MRQLYAYGEGTQHTPSPNLESGQVKTSSSNVSAPPDLSQDGDLAPPSFVPGGPDGAVTSHQDLPPPASLPVLTGNKGLAWVLPVPLPPEEPYVALLLRTGRTKQDSASLVPQPATMMPLQDLLKLPAALPRLFPTFKGPIQKPQGSFACTTPAHVFSWSLLCASSTGLVMAVPDLNMLLYQPVPPRPDAGAASDAFLSSVGRLPTTRLLPVTARSNFWEQPCDPGNPRLLAQVCFTTPLFRFCECNMVGIYTG